MATCNFSKTMSRFSCETWILKRTNTATNMDEDTEECLLTDDDEVDEDTDPEDQGPDSAVVKPARRDVEEEQVERDALAGVWMPHALAELSFAAFLAQRPESLPLVLEHSGSIAPKLAPPIDVAKLHTERRKKNQSKRGMKYKKSTAKIAVRLCEAAH
jgi:hypothetical protein